ncbi:MAG: ADP-ribosylglycohydrolase family protein [Planctomycetales bacterium]|nr:ADP-ribosylglycohydrolase family protein [Planctomycetales bacterium]
MKLSREDRIAGCLLGGALGDAVGAYFEGSTATNSFSFPSNLRVTDDTQLTIATCESIVESRAVTPESVADHFVRWFRERRITGIGASTLKAFTELESGGHWALVGATGERAAGNGAAMRIAPLAFFLDPDIVSQRQTIRDICRITHRDDEAYIGALALLRTIRHAIDGGRLSDKVFVILHEMLPDSRVRDRLADARDHSIAEYSSRFAATGYVVDSVPLAILAATKSTSITDTIQQLVHCGGDTDTIASMFGQIFGAAHGCDALPLETLNQIDAVALVRKTAANLSRTSIAM